MMGRRDGKSGGGARKAECLARSHWWNRLGASHLDSAEGLFLEASMAYDEGRRGFLLAAACAENEEARLCFVKASRLFAMGGGR